MLVTRDGSSRPEHLFARKSKCPLQVGFNDIIGQKTFTIASRCARFSLVGRRCVGGWLKFSTTVEIVSDCCITRVSAEKSIESRPTVQVPLLTQRWRASQRRKSICKGSVYRIKTK